jgi:hypothetical protein
MSASERIVLATSLADPDITPSDRLYAEALERRGFRVAGASWDGPTEAFEDADAVVIRSTWGYYRALDAFRGWTEAMAASTRLFNPLGSCAGTCTRIMSASSRPRACECPARILSPAKSTP